jgi:hypothetical protein
MSAVCNSDHLRFIVFVVVFVCLCFYVFLTLQFICGIVCSNNPFLSGGTLKQARRYGKSGNTKIYIAGRCRELLTGAEIE